MFAYLFKSLVRLLFPSSTQPHSNDKQTYLQCPCCSTWNYSMLQEEATQATYVHTMDATHTFVYTCGVCLSQSRWFGGAPYPVCVGVIENNAVPTLSV